MGVKWGTKVTEVTEDMESTEDEEIMEDDKKEVT